MESKKMFRVMIMVLSVIGLWASKSAFAEWWEWPKLIADDTEQGDRYGRSVSIFENRAVVGAKWDDDRGSASGAAYIFEKTGSTWTQVAKLVPTDIGPGDAFGTSVSIQGNRVIVGGWDSPDSHTGGVAYIFEYDGSGWEQAARLRPSGIGIYDQFGSSVAINQDIAVVGAPADDDLGYGGGAIYIFKNDGAGWNLDGTRRGYAGDQLGYSVDITWTPGTTVYDYHIVAGSPGYNFAAGCVKILYYELMLGSWHSDTITASDGAAGDRFGTSVSTPWRSFTKVIIIGAPEDNDNGEDSGSAYVFTKTSSGWQEEAKLQPEDPDAYDEFGNSVGFGPSEERVIVGACLDDDNGPSSGSAYIFEKGLSGWTQTDKLTPGDGAGSDVFGESVSLSSDTALIGARGDDNYGPNSGSAYIFSTVAGTSISGTTWYDIDRDGKRKNLEPGLEGWRIYADANDNGQWDQGEYAGITDVNGEYVISNIPPGSYVVREEPQPGWVQTFPDGSGVHVVNVEATLANSDVSFGNCSAYIYVDAGATGANNGQSWADAYKYLQDALAVAGPGSQILVAEGIYRPDQKSGQTPGDRNATFRLINGVAIRGGYSSFGEPGHNVRDRNIDAYKTILTGDLDENDDGFRNNGENSYHVVTGSGTDATALLDGVTVTGGNADGSGIDTAAGGMINQPNGKPTITNCTFSGNWATLGGAMRNFDHSSPTLTNCQFTGNSAMSGGAMYNGYYSTPTLINCIFGRNSANYGGGVYNHLGSDATVINCTFSGNSADSAGGGMFNYNNSPTLTNCILWGNSDGGLRDASAQIHNINSTPLVSYCCVQGWSVLRSGPGNISDDPLFVDAPDNLRLSSGSPCIDAGDNTAVPKHVTTDLDGHPRIVHGDFTRSLPEIVHVDMGAYEFVPGFLGAY